MNAQKVARLKRNIKLVYWLDGSWMFMVLLPVLVPFFKSKGMSMELIFLLQSIFSFSVLLLEIPSGYVSDLLGRKKTLLAGCFFHGLCFTLFPFASGFDQFVILEIFLAVGVSLFSGTDVALLYDSLEEIRSHDSSAMPMSGSMMGQKIFFTQMGETIAALVGGGLAYVSLNLPVAFNAVFSWVPFFICLLLSEPNRKKFDQGHKENFKQIGNVLFKENHLLKLIVFNTIVYSASTLIAVWSFQAHWEKLGIALFWFGPLWALTNLTVALVGKYAHRVELRFGAVQSLFIVGILPVLGFLGMGLWQSIWAVSFCFLFQITRGLGQTLLRDAINTRVRTEMRATANSVGSMGTRFIFILAGPLMGHLMDHQGHGVAFNTFGLIYMVLFFLVMLPLLKKLKGRLPQ